jgi:hypothetical protein
MSKIHSSKQYSEKVYKKMLIEKGLTKLDTTRTGFWNIKVKEKEEDGETGRKRTRRPHFY